jgi:hypothetical protein
MDTKSTIETLVYVQPTLALIVLVLLCRANQFRTILPLSLILIVRTISDVAYLVLHPIGVHERLAHQPILAYGIYFYTYWGCYIIESGLIFFLIRRLYQMALEPLEGLQHLGMIVFRWIAVASVLIAVFTSIAPNVTGSEFLMNAAMQLQRTQSVLVLCMLFFLTFTSQPLAFTYKSRIFGVGMGFGLMACYDLVQAAWLPHDPHTIYTLGNVLGGAVSITAMTIWSVYYALPEAKRGLVTLPVTSPLLRWNEIGVALGYPETHIVVTADGRPMFGDAELEAMRISKNEAAFDSGSRVA